MPHPTERDPQLKVGAAYGGAHGRLTVGDDREHCTCGWESRPLTDGEQRERATVVWPGHLIESGPWSPSPEFQQRVREQWDGMMRRQFADRKQEWASATSARGWLERFRLARRHTAG